MTTDLLQAQRYARRKVEQIVGLDDAEDVLQEAAIKAFVHRRQFRKRSSYNTWFYKVARNTALMWLRANKNKRSEAELVEAYNAQSEDETPEETAARRERERRLYDAISRLSTRKRKLAALRWLAGETARGAEKAARHKAKVALREMLA